MEIEKIINEVFGNDMDAFRACMEQLYKSYQATQIEHDIKRAKAALDAHVTDAEIELQAKRRQLIELLQPKEEAEPVEEIKPDEPVRK